MGIVLTDDALDIIALEKLEGEAAFLVPKTCNFQMVICSVEREDEMWLSSLGWGIAKRNIPLRCYQRGDRLEIHLPPDCAAEIPAGMRLHIVSYELGFQGLLRWGEAENIEGVEDVEAIVSETPEVAIETVQDITDDAFIAEKRPTSAQRVKPKTPITKIIKTIEPRPTSDESAGIPRAYIAAGVGVIALLGIGGLVLLNGSEPELRVADSRPVQKAPIAESLPAPTPIPARAIEPDITTEAESEPETIAPPVSLPEPEPAPEIVPEQPQETEAERTARREARAANIRAVQTALTTLGYYDANITGELGPQTQAAIRTYREDQGLSAGMLLTEDQRADLVEMAESFAAQSERRTAEAEAQAEADRLAAERAEQARLELERVEQAQLEAQRLEAARRDAEREEVIRLEIARLEAERLETERLEAERRETERLAQEQRAQALLEQERLEQERVEQSRLIQPQAVASASTDTLVNTPDPAPQLPAPDPITAEEPPVLTAAAAPVITPARVVKRAPAYYPEGTNRTGVEILVGFSVNVKGEPTDLVVLRNSLPDSRIANRFEKSAIKSVENFEFEPKTQDGTPVLSKEHSILVTF